MAVNPLRPVLTAAAAVLLAGAVAHADNPDDQFLGMLSQDGLNVSPPDRAIAIAHQRCDDGGLSHVPFYNFRFGGQQDPFTIAVSQLYGQLQSQGLDKPQMDQFMKDAITVYCPDQMHW
ncbi:MAG TPA: DUF732 domain-containing protein [Mycobacterium sp.]|jgi:hypothetical protein|nr:DUF732 domain-containing protein [Mycobacterium sp.]